MKRRAFLATVLGTIASLPFLRAERALPRLGSPNQQFKLTHPPLGSLDNVDVVVNGMHMIQGEDYTLGPGGTIVMAEAPPSNSEVMVMHYQPGYGGTKGITFKSSGTKWRFDLP
jgi:hypothetical protein